MPYAPGQINGIRAFAKDSLDQGAHMPDALRDHDPKLRKMRPERVRQHRLLPDQKCLRAMQHENSLLIGALDRTNRMFGRVTASQIASASVASFFPRLT